MTRLITKGRHPTEDLSAFRKENKSFLDNLFREWLETKEGKEFSKLFEPYQYELNV